MEERTKDVVAQEIREIDLLLAFCKCKGRIRGCRMTLKSGALHEKYGINPDEYGKGTVKTLKDMRYDRVREHTELVKQELREQKRGMDETGSVS